LKKADYSEFSNSYLNQHKDSKTLSLAPKNNKFFYHYFNRHAANFFRQTAQILLKEILI